MLSIVHRKVKFAISKKSASFKLLSHNNCCESHVLRRPSSASNRRHEPSNEVAHCLLCTGNFCGSRAVRWMRSFHEIILVEFSANEYPLPSMFAFYWSWKLLLMLECVVTVMLNGGIDWLWERWAPWSERFLWPLPRPSSCWYSLFPHQWIKNTSLFWFFILKNWAVGVVPKCFTYSHAFYGPGHLLVAISQLILWPHSKFQ